MGFMRWPASIYKNKWSGHNGELNCPAAVVVLKTIGTVRNRVGIDTSALRLIYAQNVPIVCYDPSSTLGNQFTGLGMAYRSPSVYISRILYKLYL